MGAARKRSPVPSPISGAIIPRSQVSVSPRPRAGNRSTGTAPGWNAVNASSPSTSIGDADNRVEFAPVPTRYLRAMFDAW